MTRGLGFVHLARVWQGEDEVQRRRAECPERDGHGDDRLDRVRRRDSDPPLEQALARRNTLGPGGFTLGGPALLLGLRPHALAQEGCEGRQQRQRDHDGDNDCDRCEDAHDREERDPCHCEAGQGDRVGGASEDDGGAGRADCAADRILEFHAGSKLIAVTGEDEEGVVDADGQPEHGRQHRHRRVDLHEARGRKQHRHRQRHTQDRGDDGNDGRHC